MAKIKMNKIKTFICIGTNKTNFKGVKIPKGTGIARSSIITKSFKDETTLISRYPAKFLEKNISWEV